MAISTLFIANRGEIAVRILRAARELGIRTVQAHSQADADSLAVKLADQAVEIGPPQAARSYLNVAAILKAAKSSGADAIHPGYGFLAENADFAEACAAAGLTFVGPPPAAIRAMGAKDQAKACMAKAGVPVLPGYHGKGQSRKELAEAAGDIGFPVLIKPAAGGGGKGMRLVEEAGAFPEALDGARREAAAAFGDDRVIIEKFLVRPRHIEVQIFADRHGNAVHLFERDCSTQRRHQKVIEEAPAPGLSAKLRSAMGRAAVAAARAIGYVGAGTIEFLVSGKAFYFMEMNTRLQVEHPITEMITGHDLVDWQLRVAAGEALPCRQRDLAIRGHAIEARLYAEDPARDFLPAAGRLERLSFPKASSQVRIDSGVREGDEISLYYDPMIAKLIVAGKDRPAALARLERALVATRVSGVATNLEFLQRIAAQADYRAGRIDTEFVSRHGDELLASEGPVDGPVDGGVSDEVLALASLAVLLRRDDEARAAAQESSDPFSPWQETDGWRLNTERLSLLRFEGAAAPIDVLVRPGAAGVRLGFGDKEVEASGRLTDDGALDARLDGRKLRATVHWDGVELGLEVDNERHRVRLHDPLAAAADQEAGSNRLIAPMPGKVVQVYVAPGDRVARGDALMALEAMKMEHTIVAPMDGLVAAVHYRVNDLVEEGVDLMDLEFE
jgi:3-methylcrotonyl-CoA carboxylase alpha subunit